MAASPDLAHFLKRRELLAYEQRLARSVYAYGVDLRRAAWLHESRLGDPLMRGVDRRWNATTQVLADRMLPPRTAPEPVLLEELARIIRLLRAPLPSVRLLRSDLDERWPLATPLGTTRGGIHLLVLDQRGLMEATPVERAYVLGWALGHLQCDHGPLFAAHWMAHQAKRSLGAVGLVLKPWARVASFSADRAAMLSVGGLGGALDGLPLTDFSDVPWLPVSADLQARRRALEDFARSNVMARLGVLADVGREEWTLGTPKPAASGAVADRLSHVLGAAARIGSDAAWLLGGGVNARAAASAAAEPATEKPSADDAEAEEPHEAAANDRPKPTPPGDPLELDPELKARLQAALKDTISIARCDQTLTRRLRLL
ncbi:MAG: hypothetical protein AAF721_17300 [Myxococcota bacterium]